VHWSCIFTSPSTKWGVRGADSVDSGESVSQGGDIEKKEKKERKRGRKKGRKGKEKKKKKEKNNKNFFFK
jgi:hypothetical protein